MKEEVYAHRSPQPGVRAHQAMWEKDQGQSGGLLSKNGSEPLLGFSWERMALG